ncbi:MAG: hypothetical protein WCQ96_02025 [Patescibacteria group bacterium]
MAQVTSSTQRRKTELPLDLYSRDLLDLLKEEGAYYEYSGEGPHPILKSKKHAGDFYNFSDALKKFYVRKIFAKRAVDKIMELDVGSIDVVVSSAYAAIPFGLEVADLLGADFIHTKKEGDGQVWSGRFSFDDNKRVSILSVEDVVTSSGTVKSVINAVKTGLAFSDRGFVRCGTDIVVVTAIHRPPLLPARYEGLKIVPVLEKESPSWDPKVEECPCCSQGSKAMEPKVGGNWRKFKEYMKKV